MLAGDKLLCSAYVSAHVASLDGESSSGGENPDKYDHLRFYNIKFNHRSIGVYSPLLQHHLFFEGSLEVKLPTIWTDEKQSREEAERRERLEETRVEEKEPEERRCRCEKR